MPSFTMWERTKTGGKAGFDKVWGWADKLGAPVNKLSNKLGSEAFWPTTLDKECDKAARILRSFCKDGFYQEEIHQTVDGPKQKQKVLKKIPAEVIRNAKGLAIFTTMRTGLWVSGAGGSGILVGRKEDGTWSPPSGILLHTAGLGFLVGVDIYDCVVVINTQQALDAFSKLRCTLGGEVSVVAGPVGAGGVLETEVHKRQAPIFTYLKSRGFYAGVQVDGTIVIERTDENERFYGQRISVAGILAGKVRHPPYETRTLTETIKAAQGDTDIDKSLLPADPAPADFEIEETGHIFGMPDKEDPDPYGVLALEKEGLEIREAGTQNRPSSEQFDFRPSPSSPLYGAFSRRSMDSSNVSRRSSWRTSTLSSIERATQMTDTSTQTDVDELPTQSRAHSPKTPPTNGNAVVGEIPEHASTDDLVKPVVNGHAVDGHDMNGHAPNGHPSTVNGHAAEPDSHPIEEDEQEEEPIVHSIHQAAAPQAISRARLVTVPKRGSPPKLPPRNPIRDRKRPLIVNAAPLNTQTNASSMLVDGMATTHDQGTGMSPWSASSRSSMMMGPESPASEESVRSFGDGEAGERVEGVLGSVVRMKLEGRVDGEVDGVGEGEAAHRAGRSRERRSSEEFHSLPTTPDGRSLSPEKVDFS